MTLRYENIEDVEAAIYTEEERNMLLLSIATYFGYELQLLIAALMRGDKKEIIEELGNVENLIPQLKHLMSIDTDVARDKKIRRTLIRIEEKKREKAARLAQVDCPTCQPRTVSALDCGFEE